jgi:hypothetical protein
LGHYEYKPPTYFSDSLNLLNTVTFDGKHTSTREWIDSEHCFFGAAALFAQKYDGYIEPYPGKPAYSYFLLESADDTNDAGDYWRICLDSNDDGNTKPQIDDFRIDIIGHTTVNWYQGDGTKWQPIPTPNGAAFTWSSSLTSTESYSTPHYVYELRYDKTPIGIAVTYSYGLFVETYDAHQGGFGYQTWPPTSMDNPSLWGNSGYGVDLDPPVN